MGRARRSTLAALACLSTLCLAPAAQANSITFTFWPDADPDNAVFCGVRLAEGRLRATELRGLGAAGRRAMEWYASEAEVQVLMAALQALSDGSVPSIDPTGSRFPAPPYASATWMAHADGRLLSGLYMQPALDLPPMLSGVIATLLPGGMCDAVQKR